MDKEIFIREFLERLESCFELLGERKHTKECEVEFDKQAARAALDRLFKDLKDFVKAPKKPKKSITGPLAEAAKAFAAFTNQQPYGKPPKPKRKGKTK